MANTTTSPMTRSLLQEFESTRQLDLPTIDTRYAARQRLQQAIHQFEPHVPLRFHDRVSQFKQLADAELSVRRTRGIRLLSELLGAMRYLNGAPDPLELPVPILPHIDAHSQLEVLIVTEPNRWDIRTGIPATDRCTLQYSPCIWCRRFEQCHLQRTQNSCRYEPQSEPQVPSSYEMPGEVVRILMEEAGLWRPSWGKPDRTVRRAIVAVTEPIPFSVQLRRIWLELLAALIEPKATIWLGNSVQVYRNRKPTRMPMDLSTTFGVVYASFPPDQVIRGIRARMESQQNAHPAKPCPERSERSGSNHLELRRANVVPVVDDPSFRPMQLARTEGIGQYAAWHMLEVFRAASRVTSDWVHDDFSAANIHSMTLGEDKEPS